MENLSQLESELWEAADLLRANSKLTAAEYSLPVLGLIFLRHAYNRFLAVKADIEPGLPLEAYTPEDVITLAEELFQHVYVQYPNAVENVYA